MDHSAKELKVVGDDQQRTKDQEGDEGPTDTGYSGDTESNRCGQPHNGDGHERPGGDVCPEGAAVQFVERVRRQPHGEEERQERGHQPRHVDARCKAGADDDVGQMPCRVRGMEQGPPIAPAAGPGGVEGRSSFPGAPDP